MRRGCGLTLPFDARGPRHFLRLIRAALALGSLLHCPSMAFRAPLQGRHIQRGDVWVAVFVICAIGRGGPHPKTQLTSAISLCLTDCQSTS